MRQNGNHPHIVQNFQVFDCLDSGFEDGKVEQLAEDERIQVMRREEANGRDHIPNTLIGIKLFRHIVVVEFLGNVGVEMVLQVIMAGLGMDAFLFDELHISSFPAAEIAVL